MVGTGGLQAGNAFNKIAYFRYMVCVIITKAVWKTSGIITHQN